MPNLNLFAEIDRARAEAAERYEQNSAGIKAPKRQSAHPVITWLRRAMLLAIPFALIFSLVGGQPARDFLTGAYPFVLFGAFFQLIRWLSALHLLRPGIFGGPDPTPRSLVLSTIQPFIMAPVSTRGGVLTLASADISIETLSNTASHFACNPSAILPKCE